MSSFLWQQSNQTLDQSILEFTAGDDVALDRYLFQFDIQATSAHVLGLQSIGLLKKEETEQLREALTQLQQAFQAGDFTLDQRFEDGHSAIEWYLTEKLGDTGKKVHTGRSRNDQVLVAQRLYMKDRLSVLAQLCKDIAKTCLHQAHQFENEIVPGYTHLQHGTVSSLGLWFGGIAEAFIDNIELANHTLQWIDCNPLGTTAGYGVNLPLDRQLTTEQLQFDRVQLNSLYTQNSRGKFELQTLMAFAQAMQDVRRLAWDISLYNSAEFGFVKLPDQYTTGSSFMPNKRNPDVVELLRAAAGQLFGKMVELQSNLSLPSGYHRDLQNTKEPLIMGIEKAVPALALVPNLVAGLEFDLQKMRSMVEPEMFAADVAIKMSHEGIPFRDAYRQAMQQDLSQVDPVTSIRERVSPGAPGNLRLDSLQTRLDSL